MLDMTGLDDGFPVMENHLGKHLGISPITGKPSLL